MNKNTLHLTSQKILLNPSLKNFIANTSASVYWKNTKGAYLDINKIFLHVSGMSSYTDVINKTDLDLLWAEQAPIMRQNDREIVETGLTKTYIESAKSPDNTIVHYLSYKTPLCNQRGKKIGTFGLSFLINDVNSINKALGELSTIGCPIELISAQSIARPKPTTNLTPRQKECLYYLVRGMTMKKIAEVLQLSPKTVEHYLDAIKIKLNCFSRTELIAKAFDIGLVNDNF